MGLLLATDHPLTHGGYGSLVRPDTVQAQIQSGVIFGVTAAL